MNSFQQDLVKILLDKLLLGLIAAGFGFYLSRLLEDYRTKNAYKLAVLQQRILACRELMALVGVHQVQIMAVWQMLETLARKHPDRLTDEEAKPGYDYIRHYDEFKKTTSGLVGMTFPPVVDALITYMNESGKVADIIKGKCPDPPPTQDSLVTAHCEFIVTLGNFLSKDIVE